MTGNSCRHRANYKNKGVLEAETVSVIDVLHVGDTLNYLNLNSATWNCFITETGVPGVLLTGILETGVLLIGILETGSRVLLTEPDKIRVPGMLLTGILEIGVLEVLLIGVLLPSGPDNLAIGAPPVVAIIS